MTIVYRLGKKTMISDALSRIPEHAQPQHARVTATVSQTPHTEGPRVAMMSHNKHAALAPYNLKLVYKVLQCTHCNRIHVDQGKWGIFNHCLHVYQFCHRMFHSDETCIGTELPYGLHAE